jgi:hypothetical protein
MFPFDFYLVLSECGVSVKAEGSTTHLKAGMLIFPDGYFKYRIAADAFTSLDSQHLLLGGHGTVGGWVRGIVSFGKLYSTAFVVLLHAF